MNNKLVRVNTKIEVHEFCYQWNIENFRFSCNKPPGKALNSPIFSIPSTKVKGCLKVYPGGIYEGHKDYVSVCLELKNYEDADLIAKFSLWIPGGDADSGRESKLVNFSMEETFGFSDFINRDYLLNSDILVDEKLTLMCDVSVSTGAMKSCDLDGGIVRVESRLVTDLEQLLKERSHADVILKIGDQHFEAHKVILRARSKTFKKMFADYPNKRDFEIDNIPVKFMNDFLQYVYTGKITVTGLKLIEFWETLVPYQLYMDPELRNKCEKQLLNEINNETAADLIFFADDYDFDRLYYKSLNYIVKNLSSVIHTVGYKNVLSDWSGLSNRIVTRMAEIVTVDSL